MLILTWALQVLILTAGIHLFLRFVRTTRGNRMIRGLLVTVLGGVVGLWGLSQLLDLEELRHLLEISTGFIVVTLAIVFQPELRRAMAQIGERSILGRLMKSTGRDTVSHVVRAARSMASRRIGALIAFERESSLHTYIEEGTPIDSAVNARLLESIFHPGTALHDGAVIIRKDRVAAAGCIFPLPHEGDIDASMGTRHRASMGLTEETDAVVLVVSEETGRISIAREGRIATSIKTDTLEEELRAILAGRESSADPVRRRVVPSTFGAWKRDILWLLGSALVATGILYVAHQDILETRQYNVRIRAEGPSGAGREPADREILVVLPRDTQVQKDPPTSTSFIIEAEGTRAELERAGYFLSGVLNIGAEDWAGGFIDLDQVQWEQRVEGLSFSWKGDQAPNLEVEEYATKPFTLALDSVVVDSSGLDPRYQLRLEELSFVPAPEVTVRGPATRLDLLGTDELPLDLAPIVLTAEDREDATRRLQLADILRSQRFSLEDDPPVEVVLPIYLASRDIDTVSTQIALVCLDPSRVEELGNWRLPAASRMASLTIQTRGLIPMDEDPGSDRLQQLFTLIRRFVEENLSVFVDISDLPPAGEGRTVPVRTTWAKDWRNHLDALGLGTIELTPRHQLDVRLDSEGVILLEEVPNGDPSTGD